MQRPVRTAFAALAIAVAAPAHGGLYRGPAPATNPPGAVPGVPGLPGTPPGPGTPITGVRGGGGGDTTWESWWEFNKDPYLRLRDALHARQIVSGSDDFYMGTGRVVARDAVQPTDRDRRDLILPALMGALRDERNRDIITACLIALAKNGPVDGVDLLPTYLGYLERKDQEIRETAVLALGIHGDPAAFDSLAALWGDTAEGRRLVGKGGVDDRTRAFAGYSLGLLGRRSGDLDTKTRVFEQLSRALADRRQKDRDVLVAAVSGLGILDPLAGGDPRGRRLLWQCVESLWAFYELDLGKAEQVLQAHVPIAVARLVGRGEGPEQRRCKEVARRELLQRSRHNSIHQSAVIALGILAVPGEQVAEDKAYSDALVAYHRDGTNQAARYLALISLGRIGGAANRSALLRIHTDANKATERPWATLALGIIGHDFRKGRSATSVVDRTICDVLMRDLAEIDNKSTLAATALALGLCGYVPAAPAIRDLIDENKTYPNMRGYLCVALALMDDDASIAPIRSLIGDSVRQPIVVQQAAVALGRLGDNQASEVLTDLLRSHDSVAGLSAIAGALGFIGDRRSIQALAEMLADDEIAKLGRAFVAAALGGVGDKDPLPWNTCLSEDANFRAVVTTLLDGQRGVLDIL